MVRVGYVLFLSLTWGCLRAFSLSSSEPGSRVRGKSADVPEGEMRRERMGLVTRSDFVIDTDDSVGGEKYCDHTYS
jgi:hypothetical protein